MKAIGLDIGTTTISLVVIDDSSDILMRLTIEHSSTLRGRSFEHIQDVDVIKKTSLAAVEQALRSHPDIDCIGITGQMHGILYVDGAGAPVSPLYTWQDGRGGQLCKGGESYSDYLTRRSGYCLSTGYGLVTHFYNMNNGLVPPEAAKLCTIADFVAMSLCRSGTPCIGATNAASLGMFELRKGRFDAAALSRAGISGRMLPRVAAELVAGRTPQGIPVFVSIGDNQASFIGATDGGCDKPLINIGTGSQVSVFTEDYIEVPLLETRPFPYGGWLLVGASLSGGASYAAMEKFIRDSASLVSGQERQAYEAMKNMLDSSPKPGNLPHIVTTFQGTRHNSAVMGSIEHLNVENFTPLHFVYGIMYGIADELSALYERCLAACRQRPDTVIGAGNCLRKNPHLIEILEERLGCRILLAKNEEEAAYGAALYALSGLRFMSRGSFAESKQGA